MTVNSKMLSSNFSSNPQYISPKTDDSVELYTSLIASILIPIKVSKLEMLMK